MIQEFDAVCDVWRQVKEEADEAYDAGRMAHDAGISLESCPLPAETLGFDLWRRGWEAAFREELGF